MAGASRRAPPELLRAPPGHIICNEQIASDGCRDKIACARPQPPPNFMPPLFTAEACPVQKQIACVNDEQCDWHMLSFL